MLYYDIAITDGAITGLILSSKPIDGARHHPAIDAYLNAGSVLSPLIAIKPKGTPFQHRVWNALRQIPYGQRATYRQIAQQIGNPKATRAVGMACAANPIALMIPCHRVVAQNGSISGYRWGISIKKHLLDLEEQCT